MIDPTVTVESITTGFTVGLTLAVVGVPVAVPLSEVRGALGAGSAFGDPPQPETTTNAPRTTAATRLLMSGT